MRIMKYAYYTHVRIRVVGAIVHRAGLTGLAAVTYTRVRVWAYNG